MKNLTLFAILTIAFTSCQWKDHPPSAKEKMASGQWMSIEQGKNRERFVLNSDGGFQDLFLTTSFGDPPRTGAWRITGDQLELRYKARLFIVSVYYTSHYHINTLNDSVMVIASKATKLFASKIIILKKMKLNGKFIQG